MRQCHVTGLVNRKLKSMVKRSGHYSVFGVYEVTQQGRDWLSDSNHNRSLMPSVDDVSDVQSNTSVSSGASSSNPLLGDSSQKRVRQGKVPTQ